MTKVFLGNLQNRFHSKLCSKGDKPVIMTKSKFKVLIGPNICNHLAYNVFQITLVGKYIKKNTKSKNVIIYLNYIYKIKKMSFIKYYSFQIFF